MSDFLEMLLMAGAVPLTIASAMLLSPLVVAVARAWRGMKRR